MRLKAEKERELDGGRLGTYALECGSGNALRPESRVRARLNELLLLLLLLQMGGLFSFFSSLSARQSCESRCDKEPHQPRLWRLRFVLLCATPAYGWADSGGWGGAWNNGRKRGPSAHTYEHGAGGSFADVRLWFTGSPFSHPRVRLLVRRCGWLRFAFAFCSS